MTIHVVAAGETVASIAEQYSVPESRIISDNGLTSPFRLAVGQTLLILFPKVTHTVIEGDTPQSVANQYGITVRQLNRNNPSLNQSGEIFPGQTLVISYTENKLDTLTVNAYAYPFINKQLLNETLSFLTHMIPFTYGMMPDGSLVELDDTALIAAAKRYGTGIYMHLSTLTPEGNFSTELGTAILQSTAVQEVLIQNILDNMNEKGYSGLDIDFEYLGAENAAPYVEFVTKATKALNAVGYDVIVALAPKTFAAQPGLLYEGHPYKALGEAANFALLMTYEWGYLYGPPMAVAPMDKVRAVATYAVTEIPPEKLLLGIPNYGYDWTLPYEKGKASTPISNVEGIEIAIRQNVPIQFDETAQSPFIRYTTSEGVAHEVWFEDARSIRAKLALTTEFGLNGVAYWTMMKPFPQNWMLLNVLYNIKEPE